MKQINTYINEKLHLNAKQQYTCQPKSRIELQQIIIDRIEEEGHNCDLNDIDVSKITDMKSLFNTYMNGYFKDFNCDISLWDVSNVKDMGGMFNNCKKFNCDISKWDVSNVVNMYYMFEGCEKFNQNLDSWDVSNVEDMWFAFKDCPTQPIWYHKKRRNK